MAVQSSSNPLIHVQEAHANPFITISIFILPLSKPSHTHHHLFSLYTTTIPISCTSMHTLTPPTRSLFLPHAWLSKAPPIHLSTCMGLMQTIPSPHPSSLFSYSYALDAHMSFLCLRCPHAISLTTRGYTSPMISTSMISTLFTSMCMPPLPISLYTTTISISCTSMHTLTPTKPLKLTSSLSTPSNHPSPHSDYRWFRNPLHLVHCYTSCMKERRG